MDAVVARHRAFRALLAALAMPGTRHRVAGAEPLGLLLDALYADVEGALESGDVVVVDSKLTAQTMAGAKRGEEIAPEGGATIYVRLDARTAWTPARLTGPGVRSALETDVPFTRDVIEARARACAAFPRGVDIVTIDQDACVVAFPRTTRIEAC